MLARRFFSDRMWLTFFCAAVRGAEGAYGVDLEVEEAIWGEVFLRRGWAAVEVDAEDVRRVG